MLACSVHVTKTCNPQRDYYCKRAILCLSSSKILTPPPPSPPGECVLTPTKAGGTHSPGGEGGGGSIFWKTRDIGLPSYSNNLSTVLPLVHFAPNIMACFCGFFCFHKTPPLSSHVLLFFLALLKSVLNSFRCCIQNYLSILAVNFNNHALPVSMSPCHTSGPILVLLVSFKV